MRVGKRKGIDFLILLCYSERDLHPAMSTLAALRGYDRKECAMSHFTTEIEYDPTEFKSRRRQRNGSLALVIVSSLAVAILALTLIAVKAMYLSSIFSIVTLMIAVTVLSLHAARYRRNFEKVARNHAAIEDARATLNRNAKFKMPMRMERVPFTISITMSGKDASTYMMDVRHEDPMFKPWHYIVSQTSIRSSAGSPSFSETIERLGRLMDDPGDRRTKTVDELESGFERVGIPSMSDPQAYAFLAGLHDD